MPVTGQRAGDTGQRSCRLWAVSLPPPLSCLGEGEQVAGVLHLARCSVRQALWDEEYPSIGQSWRRNWPRRVPFFDYPPEIRKVIYTTNAIESVNYGLRRLTKHRGAFPSDEALMKLLYLALRNISKRWSLPIRDWKAAHNRFAIQFEGRIPQL